MFAVRINAIFLMKNPCILVVINGVELMLDKFDKKISNRYKLIDYRETDYQKEIIYFSSTYFAQISIPVMMGM